MKILGTISELVKVILRKSTYEVTVQPSTVTADTTFELPAAGGGTKAIVTADSSATLTNKIIDADGTGNLISNIENDNIKAGAAIDATKIADGTVTSAEFQYINSVTSNVQTQLDAKVVKNSPITGATNTKITYDASGLVTAGGSLAASDLPTGIDAAKINTGVVSNTEFNYLDGVTSAIQTQLGNKAATGANSDITSLSGLTTALSIGQGGTGQTTAQTARNALLPSQTSNTNRFLRTDGTDVSWASTGGGVGKNYLQDQYDADSAISVQQSVGDVLASSTRLNPTFFGSSDASLPLISVSADTSLRPTNNYLIAFTLNAQFIETPLFSLDGIDLGKAMAVSFAVTGVGATDDVQTYIARYNSSNVLQERIPIAGIASATTPNSARVPTGTTTFRGFFIPSSTAGDKYALRILRNATNTSMRIDALVVGPSSIQTGTAITDWQTITIDSSYLVNGTGITLNATRNKLRWRQVGNSMEVQGALGFTNAAAGSSASAFGIKIPNFSSLTISSNLGDLDDIYGMGRTEAFTLSNTATNALEVRRFDSTSVQFCLSKYPAGSQYFIKGTDVRDLNGFVYFIMFNALIPIAQWSSNVTMADRAVEEFVSNSDTSAGNNTTAFAYGPAGSLIPTITASATNGSYDKTVQFNTPIQATDLLSIEIQNGGTGEWIPLVNHDRYTTGKRLDGAAKIYGINLTKSTSTQVLVCFGIYGPNLPSTWGSAGATSYPITAGDRYRVRKVSGGAAVGFPVGARNVIGDTTGTAVPAGYIGELLKAQVLRASAVSCTTLTERTVTTLTLTAGVWDVSGSCAFSLGSGASATYQVCGINTAASIDFDKGRFGISAAITATASTSSYAISTQRVLVTSTEVVYLRCDQAFSGGTCTAYGIINAVRIA